MQIRPLPFWLMIVSIAIGGLAGLAVADDQLALAAADRDQRVDGLDAGLDRRVDALALDDARRDALDRASGRVALIGPLSSSGLPSGSTTRPISAAPTGTSTTRPVVLTWSPSLICL